MNAKVAIPSTGAGGLDAEISGHFGHCDIYTVVSLAQGEIAQVETIPAVPHQQGGCLAPVNYLAQNGVQVLISGGMGLRPLLGFEQAGIRVYYGADASRVQDAVEALLEGRLPSFSREFTCGGGGGLQQSPSL